MCGLYPESRSQHAYFRLFRHMDADGSGLMTYPEMVRMVREVLKVPPSVMPDGEISAAWRYAACVHTPVHTRTRTELKVSAIKRVQSKREKERERTHQSLPPLFSLPPPPPFPYVCFPHENGTYLCFIMCLNCCFIVIVNNMMKYINNIGQNTGTSKTGKKVMEKATIKLFADLTQNLNSGSFRTKGLQR